MDLLYPVVGLLMGAAVGALITFLAMRNKLNSASRGSPQQSMSYPQGYPQQPAPQGQRMPHPPQPNQQAPQVPHQVQGHPQGQRWL